MPLTRIRARAVADDDDWETDPDFKNEGVSGGAVRRVSENLANSDYQKFDYGDDDPNKDKTEKEGGDDEADMTEAGAYHSRSRQLSHPLSH